MPDSLQERSENVSYGDAENWDWYEEEDALDLEPEDSPDKSRREYQQAKLDFETSGKDKYDSMLEAARLVPPANGMALPAPEESTWMTE